MPRTSLRIKQNLAKTPREKKGRKGRLAAVFLAAVLAAGVLPVAPAALAAGNGAQAPAQDAQAETQVTASSETEKTVIENLSQSVAAKDLQAVDGAQDPFEYIAAHVDRSYVGGFAGVTRSDTLYFNGVVVDGSKVAEPTYDCLQNGVDDLTEAVLGEAKAKVSVFDVDSGSDWYVGRLLPGLSGLAVGEVVVEPNDLTEAVYDEADYHYDEGTGLLYVRKGVLDAQADALAGQIGAELADGERLRNASRVSCLLYTTGAAKDASVKTAVRVDAAGVSAQTAGDGEADLSPFGEQTTVALSYEAGAVSADMIDHVAVNGVPWQVAQSDDEADELGTIVVFDAETSSLTIHQATAATADVDVYMSDTFSKRLSRAFSGLARMLVPSAWAEEVPADDYSAVGTGTFSGNAMDYINQTITISGAGGAGAGYETDVSGIQDQDRIIAGPAIYGGGNDTPTTDFNEYVTSLAIPSMSDICDQYFYAIVPGGSADSAPLSFAAGDVKITSWLDGKHVMVLKCVHPGSSNYAGWTPDGWNGTDASTLKIRCVGAEDLGGGKWRFRFNIAAGAQGQGYQRGAGCFSLELQGEKGAIELFKQSANKAVSDSDPAYYSLQGAVYGVYSDEGCTAEAATITTDENGYGKAEGLAPGGYWVKEKSASPGYEVNPNVVYREVKSNDTARIDGTDAEETPIEREGWIELWKKSSDTSVTENNSCYTLAGAVFAVKDASGNTVDTLTTDEDGYAKSKDLPVGNYTVTETKAPAGFAINTRSDKDKNVTVSADASAKVEFTNTPKGDPVEVVLVKRDKDTDKIVAQGDGSLAGAQFTIKYYKGQYSLDNLPSKAERTWVVKTDANGQFNLQTDHNTLKVSGDDWYLDSTYKKPYIPLGTVAIQETKAPTGYSVNPELYVQTITDQNVGTGDWVMYTWNLNTVTDAAVRGGLSVDKTDFDLGESTAQGDATLAGAKFAVKNVSANAIEAHLDGKKDSSKTVTAAPGADIAGLVLTTDENGHATTDSDGDGVDYTLPYGTYELRETAAPAGYKLSDAKVTIEVHPSEADDGTVYTKAKSGDKATIADEVKRYGVSVDKVDPDTGEAAATQGDATLAGAVFSIENASKAAVVVDGKTYGVGQVVKTVTTDENGHASTDADGDGKDRTLPYGTYKVYESKAPTGYLLSDEVVTFSCTEDHDDSHVFTFTGFSKGIEDKVIRAGLTVVKRDAQTGEPAAQGGATLEGAEFTITNKSGKSVFASLDGTKDGARTEIAVGAAVMTITTDADGVASTPQDADGRSYVLPYGTYELAETKAPQGYMPTDETVTIVVHPAEADDGKVYGSEISWSAEGGWDTAAAKWSADGLTFANRVKRGDLEFSKKDGASGAKMSYVPFLVVSKSNGEAHVAVTDENGTFSTTAAWNPHTQSTNANDSIVGGLEDGQTLSAYYASNPDVSKWSIDVSKADYEAGIWFGTNAFGTVCAADDSLGALPYDTERFQEGGYLLVELPCEANEGMTLVSTSFNVSRDVYVIDYGTVDDNPVSIGTTATYGDSGEHEGQAAADAVIVDKVAYDGLIPKQAYRLAGTLMDAETGEAVKAADGSEVTASAEFTPETASGEQEVTFSFDASGLSGHSVVVFEKLYDASGNLAAQHADIEDEGQTVSFVEIGTKAADVTTGTNEHGSSASATIKLVDTVSYKGLTPGKTYTVKGTLMDKETGEALKDADSKAVTSEVEFKAAQAEGSVDMTFEFPATYAAGKTVVAFEEIYRDGRKLAVHADIDDREQSVPYPKIATKAKDKATGGQVGLASAASGLVDTVSFENLVADKAYKVSGVLMDKATGKALKHADGTDVTASAEFTPRDAAGVQVATKTYTQKGEDGTETAVMADYATGSIDIEFAFDASAVAGKTTVAFERLSADGVDVASHEDIDDEGQTVAYPGIGTTAKDAQTETHEGLASEKVTIVDTVSYSNLTPGKTYKLAGTLMDKATGEELKDADGNAIVSEAEFAPEAASGSAEVAFTADGSLLKGKSVVVFEDCYDGDTLVAVHADISDEGQTVAYPGIGTTAKDAQTETHEGLASGTVTIVDTVSYSNLTPGKTYKLAGTLMDKATGEELKDADGNAVTASAEFVAEEASGSADVPFTFDASLVKGKTVVAFEELSRDGKTVAAHADIDDEAQTVSYPEIGTEAVDGADGDHEVSAGQATVIDTVSYSNLTPGKAYTVSGTLMDKATGEELKDADGNAVTASAEFTPEEADGSAKVEFSFDASGLEGAQLVAFEQVYDADGNLVAEHADIDDEAQTVAVAEPAPVNAAQALADTIRSAVKTGDKLGQVLLAALMAAAAAAIAAGCAMRRRRKLAAAAAGAEKSKAAAVAAAAVKAEAASGGKAEEPEPVMSEAEREWTAANAEAEGLAAAGEEAAGAASEGKPREDGSGEPGA